MKPGEEVGPHSHSLYNSRQHTSQKHVLIFLDVLLMPTRDCESQTSRSQAAAERSGTESSGIERLGGGQRTERSQPVQHSTDKMKALQKSQGRTDQILGAMADMLTSLALPNQQWVSRTTSKLSAIVPLNSHSRNP